MKITFELESPEERTSPLINELAYRALSADVDYPIRGYLKECFSGEVGEIVLEEE